MKKLNYLFAGMLFAVVGTMTSCSSDSDHADCHECHIATENADGTETMWEIANSSGGEEFCGSELQQVEDPEYVHTTTEILFSTDSIPLLPGEYGPGSTDSLAATYEIHCEEHAH